MYKEFYSNLGTSLIPAMFSTDLAGLPTSTMWMVILFGSNLVFYLCLETFFQLKEGSQLRKIFGGGKQRNSNGNSKREDGDSSERESLMSEQEKDNEALDLQEEIEAALKGKPLEKKKKSSAPATTRAPRKQEAVKAKVSTRISAITLTWDSFRTMSRSVALLGVILFYAYNCEHNPINPQGHKGVDFDFFWFVAVMFFLLALLRVEPGATSEVLNRDQSEEWKGWMQYLFLAYHYFHFTDIYNSVRVYVSCYVWMTGFGNFSFFYMKHDFTFVRFVSMMWRMNFLVFFLCMTLDNTYILYYICPLHTFYFLTVFVVMRVMNSLNHSEWGIRKKLFVWVCVLYFIWEVPSIFEVVFFFLPKAPMVGATSGIQFEWHFRSGLDHWSTLFGMLFALNFPMYNQFIVMVEKLRPATEWVIKGVLCSGLILASYLWKIYVYDLPKLEYNTIHPYFFFIPLLTFVFLRNLTPWLRSIHIVLLAEMGKITLETYLMQHHIWLTSNAKTLLVLLPGYPKLNLILTTLIYLFVAQRLYRITINLRAMIIPSDYRSCLRNLGWLFGVMTLTLFVAYVYEVLEITDALSVFVAVLFLSTAMLLVFVQGLKSYSPAEQRPTKMRLFGVIFGVALTLFLFHSFVVHMSPFQPHAPLPLETLTQAECLAVSNDGDFVEHACDTSAAMGECVESSWVWEEDYQKICDFHRRSSKEVKSMFAGRKITVLGDIHSANFASSLRGPLLSTARPSMFSEVSSGVYFKKFNLDTIRVQIVFDNILVDNFMHKISEAMKESDFVVIGQTDFLCTECPEYEALYNLLEGSNDRSNSMVYWLSPSSTPIDQKAVKDLSDVVDATIALQTVMPEGFVVSKYDLFGRLFVNSAFYLPPLPAVMIVTEEEGNTTSAPATGLAQDMGLGFVMVIAAVLLLVTQDNFFGLSWVALWVGRRFSKALDKKEGGDPLPEDISLKWEDAYSSLNAKIMKGIKNREEGSSLPS